jgi:hypothetical protein
MVSNKWNKFYFGGLGNFFFNLSLFLITIQVELKIEANTNYFSWLLGNVLLFFLYEFMIYNLHFIIFSSIIEKLISLIDMPMLV